MNLHHLYVKEYDAKNYNCFHFVVDVWKELKNQDIGELYERMLVGRLSDRRLPKSGVKSFESLSKPIDPCIVAFHRRQTTPHVGVWLDNKVFHLTEQGVHHVDLYLVQVMGIHRTRFYLP